MGMTQPKNTHHVLFVHLDIMFLLLAGTTYFTLSKACRLVLGPTHLSIQWVMVTSALEVKKQTCEADHSPP
jgi:hypothetical protein